MNRFGAFAVHLGISLIIFIILGYLILFHWYPDFFFTSDGGWQGIRIVAFVDLVLGPVLTLVVFNNKKPKAELRRDLCFGYAVAGLNSVLCAPSRLARLRAISITATCIPRQIPR